ncbi:hypothetical protein [Microbulbifer marinus]|nr:hypothetical protein [Microbulbifer marinus]
MSFLAIFMILWFAREDEAIVMVVKGEYSAKIAATQSPAPPVAR